MNETITPWQQLQALLDKMLGFPNRTRTTVKKIGQTFDNKTQEHVVVIEYRARVAPAITPKQTIEPQRSHQAMATIREILSISMATDQH